MIIRQHNIKVYNTTIEHEGMEYEIYVKLVDTTTKYDTYKKAYVYMTNLHDDCKLYWAKTVQFNKAYNGTQFAPYGLDYYDDDAIANKMVELIKKNMEETLQKLNDAWYEEDDENFVSEDDVLSR